MIEFYRHPVDNPVITGRFGDWYTRPGKGTYQHRGVDYGCPPGTPIFAPCPGTGAWYSNPSGDFGVAVCMVMRNGMYVLFGHMTQKMVAEGQPVETGQLVGYSGNTGDSQGPHLHWQYSVSPYFPADITQNRDPLLELDESMMSPEERLRLESLEALFGGQMMVQQFRAMGIRWDIQVDQQNTAIFTRLNQHIALSHPGTMPITP